MTQDAGDQASELSAVEPAPSLNTASPHVRRLVSRCCNNAVGLVSGVLLTLVSGWCVWSLFRKPGDSTMQTMTAILWSIWATAPPLFFLGQWFGFEQPGESEAARKARFDDLKYGHDLASKFWLGGVAVLSGVLLKTFDPAAATKPACTPRAGVSAAGPTVRSAARALPPG